MLKFSHFFYLISTMAAICATAQAAQLKLLHPPAGSEVAQLKPAQKKYLSMSRPERAIYYRDEAARELLSQAGPDPQAVELTWEWTGADNTAFSVTYAATPGFEQSTTIKTTEPRLELFNLLIGQKYHWYVTAHAADSPVRSESSTFTTEDLAPRILYVPGVPNVRDLGGWRTASGKRVKQGLIYRTAGLNENATTVYYTRKEMEELAARDPGKAEELSFRAPWDDAVARSVAAFEKEIKEVKTFKVIPFCLSDNWQVFQIARTVADSAQFVPQLSSQREIPANLMGAARTPASATAGKPLTIRKNDPKNHIVVMQQFESGQDGYMHLQCDADRDWSLWINGQLISDKHLSNNKRDIIKADNYLLALPLRRGTNLLTVEIKSSGSKASWHYQGTTLQRSTRSMLRGMARHLQTASDARWDIVKERIAGPTRITPQSHSFFVDTLGLVSDIDLRSDAECWSMQGSPLGDRVKWLHYQGTSYAIISSGGKAFSRVFKALLDERNYPLCFHCILGRDRTGGVAFIINGLLGVAPDDLYNDWRVTDFRSVRTLLSSNDNRYDFMVSSLDKYRGSTLQEKLESFIISLGYTRDDIAKLRSMLLEE